MAKHLDTEIKVDQAKIPLRVYIEPRRNVRIAVGKKHVILRMPRGLKSAEVDDYLDWAEKWVTKQYHTTDTLKNRFVLKEYKTGDTITVQDVTYELSISEEDRKSHAGKIIGNRIILKLSKNDKELNTQRAIKRLLSRLISHSFLPEITARVHELNNQLFKKEIKSVRLKYNTSNWGSCSSKGNVNLSSRLLFAPKDIIDYVIIHELAHLIELNHSARFWSLVRNAMPNYKQKEKWLKVHSSSCDF